MPPYTFRRPVVAIALLLFALLFVRTLLQPRAIVCHGISPAGAAPFWRCEGGYDPINGACNNGDAGGAWNYKQKSGACATTEATAPGDRALIRALPRLLPGTASALDYGGGIGIYLTGLRDAGVAAGNLVVVEPVNVSACAVRGVTHVQGSVPSLRLPRTFDLVMSLEVAEHFPPCQGLEDALVDFMVGHAAQWVVFSAAHPGQEGQGHANANPPGFWRAAFSARRCVAFDEEKTAALKAMAATDFLQENLHVFRKTCN